MSEFELRHVTSNKNKKVHGDFNTPREAMEFAKKQEKAWYELMGGNTAKVGNDWDPWNIKGVDWYTWKELLITQLTED